MEKSGGKLIYLGERSGLQGWFVMMPKGIQVVYVTPDAKTVLIGGMFTADGKLVTGKQMQAATENNKEFEALAQQNAKENVDMARAGAATDGFASLDMTAKTATGAAKEIALPSVVLPPGDRLLQDLQAAAGQTLGKGQGTIYMIVSPNCPYCKETWKELRDSVQQGQVSVKLVILGNGDPVKTRVAGKMLTVADPLAAWSKFVDGDTKALEGAVDDLHLKAAAANDALIKRWDIRVTPYIAYRAKDKKVKIVQGRPDRIAAILTDLDR
jgi:hypothetical protein